MKINNNNKNIQQNKNFINNNFNNQYESQKNNPRVLSSNTKPFTISFGNNKFTTNNNIINNNMNNNKNNFNINNYNANYFFNNQNYNFQSQNLNNNIKYIQSNNFSQHKPRLYSKPFSVKKSLNSRVKEYSIYQNNNLETSQVYDLHKANWDVTKENRPTARLRHIKTCDPFKMGNKHHTNFGYVYSAGGIPCRIEHGNVNMKLKWEIEPENLDYDPTLIICFEGLLETEHPYNFLAKQCCRELLCANGANEKVIPILKKIIDPLKMALNSNKEEIFLEAMNLCETLSDLVKENLNPFLKFFLQSINRRSFNLKYKERVFDLLRVIEMNGGPEATKDIKLKIPTYMSSF